MKGDKLGDKATAAAKRSAEAKSRRQTGWETRRPWQPEGKS